MAATLPVPIEFKLPDGWRSVSPDEVGTPNVAFVALHPATAQHGFTPNITISGEVREENVDMTDLADAALERMRKDFGEVKLGKREAIPDSNGLTQAIGFSVDLQGRPRDLVQYELFLGMRDQRDQNRFAVLHFALTSLADQFPPVFEDFGKFLKTIRAESVSGT